MLVKLANTSLADLFQANAAQAITVFGVLYLQYGLDSTQHGVGDDQVFIAALKRALLLASVTVPGALIPVEATMDPIRQALNRLKDVEPLNFACM